MRRLSTQRSSQATAKPKITTSVSSMASRKTKLIFTGTSEKRASPTDELRANRMMTPKSMMTVTPRDIWVYGPRARSSLTTAMTEEGELAVRMAAASRATAKRPLAPIVCIKGM